MPLRLVAVLASAAVAGLSLAAALPSVQEGAMPAMPQQVFGFHDFTTGQAKWDRDFLAVPDAKLAGEELKTLTAEPHVAGSPEDYKTALYVADKFKAAGLKTEIVKYTAWLNHPGEQHLTVLAKDGKVLLQGPTPEHVSVSEGGDPYQNDPRVMPGFNSSSASGDVTAPVVYANYGAPADFAKLDAFGISVKGKIVLVRYGTNYRGVKAFVAQEHGAAGVLIYSDPADDGYARGDKYPAGPYRPDTGVQRGSIQYMFQYPGDVTTPGIASTPELPESKRVPPDKATSQPRIMSLPISYHDAEPILANMGGPGAPLGFQGALPFHYHVGGAGDVRVHLQLKENYAYRTIWDVTGTIDPDPAAGADPNAWVVAGNHRDAWTYGAVDPNSGTAAMLETVHGVGALLKEGWKPKRRVVFASWDAEEEGLIGSTEWVEDKAGLLTHAVAYFNMDVGVSGPEFNASAVPSLKDFIRTVTREVPSPKGNSVYDAWREDQKTQSTRHVNNGFNEQRPGAAKSNDAVHIGDLGSGSDYTPFLQHLGVPSTDIGSDGPYGVYHSVFDNYAWFTKFADPTFVYEQQQARVFGLEVLHMADTDILPYDYVTYAQEIAEYLQAAKTKAQDDGLKLDTTAAEAAAAKMLSAAQAVHTRQGNVPSGGAPALNAALRKAEGDLLTEPGLPNRSWFKHTIYAPGTYTGYAAVVIPGVNEALDAKDANIAQSQLAVITAAVNRCAATLENAAK